jgi:predicted TIM-barrel fold metal-dependent hydrolase
MHIFVRTVRFILFALIAVALAVPLLVSAPVRAQEGGSKPGSGVGSDLYFVDAHSQMAAGLDPDIIIPLMDKAGVRHTILSARNDRKPKDVADLAARNPDRITAAVRSKGKAFNRNSPEFTRLLDIQLSQPVFRAMAEVLHFHAQKGNKAPEIEVAIDSPQSRLVLDAARRNGWPYIAHYEFAAAGPVRNALMAQFESAARTFPHQSFVLIHMGQLGPDEAKRLIEAHPNVYFMTSHSNPVNIKSHPGQPWTNLFEGRYLSPQWRDLFIANPERFILAFDNVFPEFWGDFYLEQAALWRGALLELPREVAEAVAHGNAERLWSLPVPGS